MCKLRLVPFCVSPKRLRPSEPRLRRLQAIAAGELKAFLVNSVRNGQPVKTWMPHGDSWTVTWLLEVPELWKMAVDIAPLGEMHRMFLTEQGENVLKEMERALTARKGRG